MGIRDRRAHRLFMLTWVLAMIVVWAWATAMREWVGESWPRPALVVLLFNVTIWALRERRRGHLRRAGQVVVAVSERAPSDDVLAELERAYAEATDRGSRDAQVLLLQVWARTLLRMNRRVEAMALMDTRAEGLRRRWVSGGQPWASLLYVWAQVVWLQSNRERQRAEALLDEAAHLAARERLRTPLFGEVLALGAAVRYAAGDLDAARSASHEAWRWLAQTGADDGMTRVLLDRVQYELQAACLSEANEALRLAFREREVLGDDAVARVVARFASAAEVQGATEAVIALHLHVGALIERGGASAALVSAAEAVAVAMGERNDTRAPVAYARVAVVAERAGDTSRQRIAIYREAVLRHAQGEEARAVELWEANLASVDADAPMDSWVAATCRELARHYQERDDEAAERSVVERWLGLAEAASAWLDQVEATLWIAELDIAYGYPERVPPRLAPLLKADGPFAAMHRDQPGLVARVARVLADAHDMLGRPHDALSAGDIAESVYATHYAQHRDARLWERDLVTAVLLNTQRRYRVRGLSGAREGVEAALARLDAPDQLLPASVMIRYAWARFLDTHRHYGEAESHLRALWETTARVTHPIVTRGQVALDWVAAVTDRDGRQAGIGIARSCVAALEAPADRVASLRQLAALYTEEGATDEAVTALDQARALTEDPVQTLEIALDEARVAARRGDTERVAAVVDDVQRMWRAAQQRVETPRAREREARWVWGLAQRLRDLERYGEADDRLRSFLLRVRTHEARGGALERNTLIELARTREQADGPLRALAVLDELDGEHMAATEAVDVVLERARLERDSGDLEAAIRTLEELIADLGEEDALPHTTSTVVRVVAGYLIEHGEPEAAEERLWRRLPHHTNDPSADARCDLMHLLGVAISAQGRADEGASVWREALAQSPAPWVAHPLRLDLSAAELEHGRLDRAAEHLRVVLRERGDASDPVHSATLLRLAEVRRRQGRTDEAIALAEAAVDARESTLGADEPQTLEAMIQLAGVWLRIGDERAAQRVLYRVLAREEQARGADTLVGARVLAVLGQTFGDDHESAIGVLHQALEVQERVLAASAYVALQTRQSLALALGEAGELAAAVRVLDVGVEAADDAYGADDVWTLTLRAHRVEYLVVLRPAEAYDEVVSALAAATTALGEDAPVTRRLRAALERLRG